MRYHQETLLCLNCHERRLARELVVTMLARGPQPAVRVQHELERQGLGFYLLLPNNLFEAYYDGGGYTGTRMWRLRRS